MKCVRTRVTKVKIFGLLIAYAFATILAGCASGLVVKNSQGAPYDIPTPQWVLAWTAGGNASVQSLPEYQHQYTFVFFSADSNRNYAIAAARNYNGPALAAQVISQEIVRQAAERTKGIQGHDTSDDNTVDDDLSDIGSVIIANSMTGLSRGGEWWDLVRDRQTKKEEYRCFTLYVINKEVLNRQIGANLQAVVDRNTAWSDALKAVYSDLIQEIRTNGVLNH